jgi:hypothetical protein
LRYKERTWDPLITPRGTILPTGKRMDAPCCDVFELVDGKIRRFDCYNEGVDDLQSARRLGESPGRVDEVSKTVRRIALEEAFWLQGLRTRGASVPNQLTAKSG